MPKKPVPSAEPAPVKAPRLVNVAAVKSTPREGTLIHFTAEQWKAATKGIPIGKAVPKMGARLNFYPTPDGGGLVQGDCIAMPCEICRARMRFDPQTGELFYECLCRPDPHCPEDPPPPPASNLCRFAIRVGGQPRIGCVSNGCGQRCRLTAVSQQGGRWVITCACRP